MRHHYVSVVVLLVAVQATSGQIVAKPVDPFESVAWGMTLSKVSEEVIVDPPLTLSRHAKTGEMIENNGHFFFRRAEQAFGVSVSASYAFSMKDSLLSYVLITKIESDRLQGSIRGTIDTLWNRIARRYGVSKESTELGVVRKREWQIGETYIVCLRADQALKTITLSLAHKRKE